MDESKFQVLPAHTPVIMIYMDVRDEIGEFAGFTHAQAQISILCVHEKLFIE